MRGKLREIGVGTLAALALGCGGEPGVETEVEQETIAEEAPTELAAPPVRVDPRTPVAQPRVVPGAPAPASFPGDLPVYPGAELVAAGEAENGGAMVVYETPDPSGAIVATLRDAYTQAGWSVSIAEEMDRDGLVYATKGEVLAMAAIQGLEGKTSIQITTMNAGEPAAPPE